MVTLKALVLAVAFIVVYSYPQESLPYRNTIFGDEQLEGGAFEFVNSLNEFVSRNDENNPYRLPRTVIPKHYTLRLIVNMTDLTFSGEVAIDLEATQANVNEIVLHAHDMEIRSVELQTENRTVYATHTLQPEYHFLRVRLTSEYLEYTPTIANQTVYQLKIAFQSSLRNDMTGLYRNWYRNDSLDTNVRWMASTHFQATAARFAFPCFDEPSFKATFNVTITRPSDFYSWFCTRRSSYQDSEIPGYVDDIYSTTPEMSTYLLAVIVTQYERQSVYTEDGLLKYEVIAREGAILDNQGDYAFNFGQELLEAMSAHTAWDFYSLSPNIKMTQAAIPDFSAGAMENWGLLVYREAYLMYSPNHTSTYFKQLIAYILSHEIAHMWFGNLVTCDWWDNLWLNEGFARYYQYFLTDWVDDELGLGQRFIPEQVHTALLTDSANNPHPLTNPGLGSPVEVRTMFTQISYNKGAAVIRMTEHLMGFENHREGLRRYLRNRAYKTALPIHLFQALQDAAVETGAIAGYSNFNIIDYYKTWSEQAGHPVLYVHVDHQTNQMTIYQRRFNINSGYSTSNTNWIIPITYATESTPDFNNTKPTHIIRDSVTVITRSGDPVDQWVIFNKQQTGFYRVHYDDYTWDLIAMALKGPNRTVIHEYNRAQIVDDVFQFARSGIISYTRAFNILSFLKEETTYTPWVAAINGFNWILNRVIGTQLEEPLKTLIIDWATPLMNQLTYEPPVDGEPLMQSYLRYQLAPVMCRLGVQECRDAAWSQYQALRNGNEVPVDSRNWVYCNALRNGTLEDFEYFYNRFLYHNVYNEKIQLLMVLGCTPNPVALNRFLDDIVQDNEIIRRQDYTTAFNSAATGNEENTQILFEYIKNNLEDCTRAFGSVTTPLSYVSSRLRTVEDVEAFRTWATENQQDLGSSYLAVYNAAQTSLNALEWAVTIQADMSGYFQNGDDPLSSSTPASTTTTTAPTFTAPPIAAPVTPLLPDSANTSFLSITLLALATLVAFVL